MEEEEEEEEKEEEEEEKEGVNSCVLRVGVWDSFTVHPLVFNH